ncbi:MAG: hypothetical protein WDW38_005191 [Sanguina aurantia]
MTPLVKRHFFRDHDDSYMIQQQAWIWDRIPQQADMKLVLAITVPAVLFLAREPLESGWGGYCEALESYPLPVKMATGAVGTFLGDLLAQWAGSSGVTAPGSQPVQFKYDLPRAVRFIVYATFIGTPLAHLWFGVLDDNISPLDPTSPMAVLAKMLADQVLACPVFTTLFFSSMKVMEGHPEEAVQSVKDKLWPTLVANYLLWPAAHIINFAFIPPSQRILYCNAIAVFWTAYMSYALAAKPTPAVALELTSPAEAEKQKKL